MDNNSAKDYEESMHKEDTTYMTIEPRSYMHSYVCLRRGCGRPIGSDGEIVANVGLPNGVSLYETYHSECYKKVRAYYENK